MTKEELLAALRAAPGPSRELDAEIALATGYFDKLLLTESCRMSIGAITDRYVQVIVTGKGSVSYSVECPAFTSSLDAADAFRERMLPGWDYCISRIHGEYEVSVGPEGSFMSNTELCATECLSIVAAVVAGVIAQERKT
jgi:hypothetical protein